jgi:hypothetical protein
LTKTEIKNLEERISQLNANHGAPLSTEEANTVRWFWIQLTYTREEAEEETRLRQRQDTIFRKWETATPEERQEYDTLEKRIVEICHDTVMQRVVNNHAMRDRVWPELAPRVLRFHKLAEKPSGELTSEQKRELETLTKWFSELQREALGETHLSQFGSRRPW